MYSPIGKLPGGQDCGHDSDDTFAALVHMRMMFIRLCSSITFEMTGFTFDSSRTYQVNECTQSNLSKNTCISGWNFAGAPDALSLEDRIRELCARVLSAQNDIALDRLIPQLQVAIKEYVQETRTRVAEVIRHTFRSDSDDQAA
jgi:hypothetical protein